MTPGSHPMGAHHTTGKGWSGSFTSLARMLTYHERHVFVHTTCLWGAPDAADRSGCR
jgi:hypothetical protein